jgi:riboflavin synthase
MFTGIIRELGRVDSIDAGEDGARLRISAELSSELEDGDSVAVNGACLTATSTGNGAFEADVMKQTLSLTTLGELSPESTVNLELPLRPTDRIGGHVVQGHVDGTATVAEVAEEGFAKRLRLELPDELHPYVVDRGSIAIEGVSLTVASLTETGLEVSLIPETLERTTLGRVELGDRLNVECDVLARYVRRQLSGASGVPPFVRGSSEAKAEEEPVSEGGSLSGEAPSHHRE